MKRFKNSPTRGGCSKKRQICQNCNQKVTVTLPNNSRESVILKLARKPSDRDVRSKFRCEIYNRSQLDFRRSHLVKNK